MNILQLLKSRLSRDISVAESAERIADASFELIWRHVQGRVLTLSPAEARGYVRARARGSLQRAVEEHPMPTGFKSLVFAQAMDKTLRRVATQTHAIQSSRPSRAAA